MTMELLRGTLAWSAVLNMGILLWWFLFITFADDWVYKMHSRFSQSSAGNSMPSIMPEWLFTRSASSAFLSSPTWRCGLCPDHNKPEGQGYFE